MVNLRSLNPEQKDAVEAIRGPVMVLAGAGTGKTRVITYRIAHLIDRGVSPKNVLGVTFTNKAAREMKERVRQLIGRNKKGSGPLITTFHSLSARFLRRHIGLLGYKSNFVIYDESDQLSVIRRMLSRFSAGSESTDPRAVLARLSAIRSSPADEVDEGWSEFLNQYRASLKACNAVDFDDLLGLTLELFENHPDALESCREQFQYILVDEYQDTNEGQFRIVKMLAGAHRNLCVVGDDDQSIYGWRGAEIRNLLDLPEHFPDIRVIKLEQNYRSTNTILNAANAVIRNNSRRTGKSLWSQNGEGAKIRLFVFPNAEEEAKAIIERIEFNRVAYQIPWGTQAILLRTNHQSRTFETALRQTRVPYRLIGGQSFFDRREIRDFLAYIKILVNPDDDNSLLRVANTPPRGLSDKTMSAILGASEELGLTVGAAMRDPAVLGRFTDRVQARIAAFVELQEGLRRDLDEPSRADLKAWTEELFDRTGYFDYLRRTEKEAEVAEGRIRNLRDMVDGIPEEGSSGKNGSSLEKLTEFLESLALDMDRHERKEDRPGDQVTLITMHGCKGLEFPHVFIVGLEDGLIPHSRAKEEGSIDEERRLFYVAITRARETLTMSYSNSRKSYGQFLPCHPSPFLTELPTDLVIAEEECGAEPVATETAKNIFDSIRESIS